MLKCSELEDRFAKEQGIIGKWRFNAELCFNAVNWSKYRSR